MAPAARGLSMSATHHRSQGALLAVLVAGGLLTWLLPPANARLPTPRPNYERELLTLRRERRDVAASLFERLRHQFEQENKLAVVWPLMTAAERLLESELELCETPADRVAVLERHLEAMERFFRHEYWFLETGRLPFAGYEFRSSYFLRDARVRLYEARKQARPPSGD